MNIKELRVDNLVMAKSPEKIQWQCPVKLNLGYFEMLLNDKIHVKPIPLTEEWFWKLGFIYDGWYCNIKSYFIEINGINFYSSSQDNFNTCKAHYKCNMPVIKYVHQLQNLYFILTGYELKLK